MCQKCDQTAQLIQEWVNQQGHNRCWYYPDIFRRLAEIHQVTPTVPPALPALAHFKQGCNRYQHEEFEMGVTYDEAVAMQAKARNVIGSMVKVLTVSVIRVSTEGFGLRVDTDEIHDGSNLPSNVDGVPIQVRVTGDEIEAQSPGGE